MRDITQIIKLKGLSACLQKMADELRISDLRAAADALTIPFEKVNNYVHGKGVDIDLTERLIRFFHLRMERLNEH